MTVHVIDVDNVNEALESGLFYLAKQGGQTNSRNGAVLVAPGPVVTTYRRPWERVMFSALRDANPFFHLYECIWMLAGRDDAASVGRYAKTMETFADADGTLHGAYGHRWRTAFGFDQLYSVMDLLRSDPSTRRAVLQMWSPNGDLLQATSSKDVPCNTNVYLDTARGSLDMTVCNRSNDIVWGAYGANYVHMGFLQEVLSAALDVPMGVYHQFSNNYHTYAERPDVARLIRRADTGVPGAYTDAWSVAYRTDDRYRSAGLKVRPFVLCKLHLQNFLRSCERLAADPCESTREDHPFLHHVFAPMMRAHREYKYGDYRGARYALAQCQAPDWKVAAMEWLDRREGAAKEKALHV